MLMPLAGCVQRVSARAELRSVHSCCCCSGNYDGPEPQRLATLKYAAMRGAPHVDVEFKAAQVFFASR
jgi:hypothetical protein